MFFISIIILIINRLYTTYIVHFPHIYKVILKASDMRIGIIDICKQIEDPRMDRKKVHKMETIIYIVAVLCGTQSWNEIEEFGNAKFDFFKSRIPNLEMILSYDTFNRFFSIIQLEYLELIFLNWVKQVCKESKGVVAIDGKLMRGPSKCYGKH